MSRESDVLAAVLRAFDGAPDVRLWRNTTGHAVEWGTAARGAAQARHITYGLGPGSPDVVGVLTVGGVGVWIGLEVKSASGKVAPAQAAWLGAAQQRGMVVGVVRSADEAKAVIDAARVRLSEIIATRA